MPTIKLTTNEMREAFESLNKLGQTKMPTKAAYWVARLNNKLQADYQASETARTKLVEELGEKVDGQGARITQENTNWPTFIQRYNELMNAEIEIEAPQIPLAHFGTIDIEPMILARLDKFITNVDEAVS